jgi:murein DD-endopeptidase MepM/ murein hydrolase activator NlpD
VFGRRKEPHTVIIARGDEIRHFTVRPWMAAFLGSAVSAVAIGYLLATSYLVLRDDLMGAAVARQARMQQAYEDRISALRTQVDRITSRQLLDQQLMETKVAELLERQSTLSRRQGRLEPILERADEAGKDSGLPRAAPMPETRPQLRVEPIQADANSPLAFFGRDATSPAFDALSQADQADKLFGELHQSLRLIESDQLERLGSLADDAYRAADGIKEALASVGLELDEDVDEPAQGGPFLAPPHGADAFEEKVQELDQALDALDSAKALTQSLPLANPAPNRSITSTYGVRKDPLLGRPAMHAGIDFRVPVGVPTLAAGDGVVVKAGRNGGYGLMIEVDHGDGFSTRYAHLSRIAVKVGDRVGASGVIGQSGSTGRSTGPHLHYEVRKNGKAVDPLRFLKAGKKIGELL